jgi:hypothetical protein
MRRLPLPSELWRRRTDQPLPIIAPPRPSRCSGTPEAQQRPPRLLFPRHGALRTGGCASWRRCGAQRRGAPGAAAGALAIPGRAQHGGRCSLGVRRHSQAPRARGLWGRCGGALLCAANAAVPALAAGASDAMGTPNGLASAHPCSPHASLPGRQRHQRYRQEACQACGALRALHEHQQVRRRRRRRRLAACASPRRPGQAAGSHPGSSAAPLSWHGPPPLHHPPMPTAACPRATACADHQVQGAPGGCRAVRGDLARARGGHAVLPGLPGLQAEPRRRQLCRVLDVGDHP